MSGRVVWVTGLSGAGKSTLASEVAERLRRAGRPVAVLDGDELRWVWGADTTPAYGRAARLELALCYARLAAALSRQGLDVIVATISLFKEVHGWNRANLPQYVEVYLRAPLEELRRRDPKGLYHRYDAGEAADIAGLDLAIDEPLSPDLLLDVAPGRTVTLLADEVVSHMQGELHRDPA